MSILPKYGKYLLHYKANDNEWIMQYIEQDNDKTDVAVPCIVHNYPLGSDIYFTELTAIDPISAFTRGANAIINKLEKLYATA